MSSINNQYKYLSLATEMLVTMLLAFFAGNYLDKKMPFRFPVFTTILCSGSVIIILVRVIKESKPPSK